MDITKNKLKSLSNMSVIPESHISYLKKLKKEYNFEPEVIYDIGACVLHWTKESLKIWPNSTYYLFDGMDSVGFLYDEIGFEYHLGVLSDVDDNTVVKNKNFKSPDLIKIDVQGCEVDILKGMTETLKTCKHLIVELQHSQYNVGAPLNVESISFIESLGFELVTGLFTNNGPDGDYHFIKKTNI